MTEKPEVVTEIRCGDVWTREGKSLEVVGGGRGWISRMEGSNIRAELLIAKWTRKTLGTGRRIWSREAKG